MKITWAKLQYFKRPVTFSFSKRLQVIKALIRLGLYQNLALIADFDATTFNYPIKC